MTDILTESSISSSDLNDDDYSTPASDYGGYVDTEADMANIHASNQKLTTRPAVMRFFDKIQTIETLRDGNTRKWLGHLSSDMINEAVPLFEDDTGVNYQVHLSYS